MSNLGFAIDKPRDSIDDTRDSFDETGRASPTYDDKDILDEDEEVDKLLHGTPAKSRLQRLFGADSADDGGRSGRAARSRRRRRTSGSGSDAAAVELMHDMEDGANKSSSESLDSFSDLDKEDDLALSSPPKKPRYGRLAGVHIVILVAFAGLMYGAYAASRKQRTPYVAQILSNGTSTFLPTTVLISLDGFRADFLNRGLTPHLNALIRAGVSPEYMLPSFPSVTFPNHFTLVTGLYPESHGVVGNTFWDPDLQEEFYYTDPERSMKPRFWQAQPIWTTAELAGIRTAIHMWPGSEAHIGPVEPTYLDTFNGKELLPNKVNRVFELLDLPEGNTSTSRPQFIAAYVPNVDADGHKFGPNSTEIRKTISSVDAMIGDIMAGLSARNLSSIVNLIVVSDHGMATTSTTRMIQLDDLIDMSQIHQTDGWPLYGLRPHNSSDLLPLYTSLKAHAQSTPGAFSVHLRDKDMPSRYHFQHNPRIAPLWLIPTAGWALVTRADFDLASARASGEIYHPRGLHGYDHEHPLMRAVFAARGPAFPHPPGSRVPPFQNTEVYGIVCDSLGLARRPGNGTLTLPLATDGVHLSVGMGAEADDLPADDAVVHVPAAGTDEEGWEGMGEMPASAAPDDVLVTTTGGAATPASTAPSSATQQANGTRPASADEDEDQEDEAEEDGWWAWFLEKVAEAKAWAAAIVSEEDEDAAGVEAGGDIASHKGEGMPGQDGGGIVIVDVTVDAAATTDVAVG